MAGLPRAGSERADAGRSLRRNAPSAASPDGKTEVMFKSGSGESVRTGRLGTLAVPGQTRSARAQARSPRALETIGIHLKIALGLSNEVGPPH